ncbi:hypothetical protein [Vagococcus xieshaowenii]|uniref:hypothetical protein n=1 Tax=Vagococcus xieshaowenii TaxID=2562451 RepID=UPI0014324386|nr:hypothetical protein [Vagococcus xieshaowenii]
MYGARIKMLLIIVFLLGGLLSQVSFKWFLVLMIPAVVMSVLEVDEKQYEYKNNA